MDEPSIDTRSQMALKPSDASLFAGGAILNRSGASSALGIERTSSMTAVTRWKQRLAGVERPRKKPTSGDGRNLRDAGRK
jgi:hypothetical protein